MGKTKFSHRQVIVNGISTHLVEVGDKKNQPILFLHGYPENWKEFEKVMELLKDDYFLFAIDLPGIGKSEPINNNDKLSIASFLKDLLIALGLKNIIMVGHDVGGMINRR